jgi:bifunctional ADP-heptose synthase (sugar kinase/adenylyltransferase)
LSFDTRSKIITLAQAASLAEGSSSQGSPVAAIVTHLDVLQAGHVHKFAQFAAAHPGQLFLILTDPGSPLAPLEARAEMAAALRVVDYVVPAPEGAAPVLAAIRPAVTLDDEGDDRERTRQLIEHVRNRSRI